MARLALNKLKYPTLIPDAVRELLDRIASFPEVAFIVLLGSRVFGDADPRSDVDVCISAPSISMSRWLQIKQMAEDVPTLLWVTVVHFESSPPDLRARNLREGVIVYESEKTAGQPR